MNEQLMNIQVDRQRLSDIDREMQQISNLAREYINATPEQRDRVNKTDLMAVLNRYNNLKQERLWLQETVVANEMEYQRALQEQQAVQPQTYGTRRRAVNIPNNNFEVTYPESTAQRIVTPWEQMLNNSVYTAGQTNVNPQITNMQNLQPNWTNISSTDWVAPDTYVVTRRKTPNDLRWNSNQWRYTY